MFADVKIIGTEDSVQLVIEGVVVLDQPVITTRECLETLIEREVIDTDLDSLDLLED